MSLIEEALRKQRQETEKSDTPPARVDEPADPSPLPEQNDETSESVPQRWTWPLLAGIAGVSLILVVGIFCLLFFGMKIWNTKPADKGTRPMATALVAPPAVTNVQRELVLTPPLKPEPVVTNTPAQLPTNTPPVTAPAAEGAPLSLPSTAITSAPAAAALPVAAPAVTPVGVETKIVRIGPGASGTTMTSSPDTVRAVIWPRLAVSGIIGTSRGARGAAIINGQMLSIGSTIEGVKIITIDKQGVQLRLGDETRTLTVGGTTE